MQICACVNLNKNTQYGYLRLRSVCVVLTAYKRQTCLSRERLHARMARGNMMIVCAMVSTRITCNVSRLTFCREGYTDLRANRRSRAAVMLCSSETLKYHGIHV